VSDPTRIFASLLMSGFPNLGGSQVLDTLISNPRPLLLGVIHDSKLFRIMAGTTGLEPATSAVTAHRSEVIQRLTNSWGTPNTTEVVDSLAFCRSSCGSELNSAILKVGADPMI